LRVDVSRADQSIKLIDFPGTHMAGIEAVFAGVTIARLAAPFTFFPCHETSALTPLRARKGSWKHIYGDNSTKVLVMEGEFVTLWEWKG
jgi:hypothetical protein